MGQTLIAYRAVRGVALVCGDPVGLPGTAGPAGPTPPWPSVASDLPPMAAAGTGPAQLPAYPDRS